MRYLLIGLMAMMLVGCGQTGPLRLTQQQKQEQTKLIKEGKLPGASQNRRLHDATSSGSTQSTTTVNQAQAVSQ